ncbi:MAG: energy-coupling factor ABC transporter ATP-binding protein, partial [Verrucomicrobiae bacterium]|nr:energy-coupling factor ABC transporter ATP-binding protein [Verrucomicrobiae bacterium]
DVNGRLDSTAQSNVTPDKADALIELRSADIASIDDLQRVVVSGVNWVVHEGDFWIISGSTGSGKSRLLETAAGLMPPDRGIHLLSGQELRKLPPDVAASLRRRVGIVFPDGGRLFPELTVAQNIALPICYHYECSLERAAPRVEQLLMETGLVSYGDWSPTRLNRSYRQRAALARALALAPEVLLLDNPLSGLDVGHADWWVEFLGSLVSGCRLIGEKPMTIVLATDDIRPWRSVATRFAMITNNRWILSEGQQAAVSDKPPDGPGTR